GHGIVSGTLRTSSHSQFIIRENSLAEVSVAGVFSEVSIYGDARLEECRCLSGCQTRNKSEGTSIALATLEERVHTGPHPDMPGTTLPPPLGSHVGARDMIR